MTNTKVRNMKTQLGNLLISQIGLLCLGIALALSRYMQTDGDQHKRIEEDTQINRNKSAYGSVSAGREKWPFNVLFFLKVEPPCDQT